MGVSFGKGIISPPKGARLMCLFVFGNTFEKDSLWCYARIRMFIKGPLEPLQRLLVSFLFEGYHALAELQLGEEIVDRDVPHKFPMNLAGRVLKEEGRGPGDIEPLHQLGPLLPETLALKRNILFFQELLNSLI